MILLILFITAALSTGAPSVTLYPQYNQALNVLVPGGTSKGGTVKFLSTFSGTDGTDKCQAACLASAERCWSFVFFPASGGSLPMKIRVASTGKQLQADDEADNRLSTRYQGDDDFSRFTFELLPGSAGQDAPVRVRVVADGRLVGADAS
eukprot:g7288.t1